MFTDLAVGVSPGRALATVSTHDLPTVAGWWADDDVRVQAELGLLGEHTTPQAKRARRAQTRTAKPAAGFTAPACATGVGCVITGTGLRSHQPPVLSPLAPASRWRSKHAPPPKAPAAAQSFAPRSTPAYPSPAASPHVHF